MTLLGALVILLHLRRRNIDFLHAYIRTLSPDSGPSLGLSSTRLLGLQVCSVEVTSLRWLSSSGCQSIPVILYACLYDTGGRLMT